MAVVFADIFKLYERLFSYIGRGTDSKLQPQSIKPVVEMENFVHLLSFSYSLTNRCMDHAGGRAGKLSVKLVMADTLS